MELKNLKVMKDDDNNNLEIESLELGVDGITPNQQENQNQKLQEKMQEVKEQKDPQPKQDKNEKPKDTKTKSQPNTGLPSFIEYLQSKKKSIKLYSQYELEGIWFNPLLNIAGGGFPLFKLSVITGFEGLGKTTLTLQQLSTLLDDQYQNYLNTNEVEFLFIDGEQRLNFHRLVEVGITPNLDVKYDVEIQNGIKKVKNIYFTKNGKVVGTVVRPITYMELDEIVEQFTEYCEQTKKLGVIIIDSLTSFLTEKEAKGDTEYFGADAKVLAPLLKKWQKYTTLRGITIIGIAHKREVIQQGYGNPNTLAGVVGSATEDIKGGRAIKFYSHQVVDLVKITSKWETYPPNSQTEFQFIYGISKTIFRKNTLYRVSSNNDQLYNVYIPEIGFSGILSILLNLVGLGVSGTPKLSTRMAIPNQIMEYLGYKTKTLNLIQFLEDLRDNPQLVGKLLIAINYIYCQMFNLCKHYKQLTENKDLLKLETHLVNQQIHKLLDFINEGNKLEGIPPTSI